jgi:outer membrane protein OmpA-like peptidoglycan-associated protein
MKLSAFLSGCGLLCSLSGHAQRADTLVIHFDYNKALLRMTDAVLLDSFFSKNHASAISRIDLYGHCDSIGSDRYNDGLSMARVLAVRHYLESKGVGRASFSVVKGFGRRLPLNDNAGPEKRMLNRRAEIVFHKGSAGEGTPSELSRILRDTATRVGTRITLSNIYFIGGRHFLLPQSLPVLDELLKAMQDNKDLAIGIRGYVCCVPDNEDGFDSDTNGRDLSEQRAKYIFDYLHGKGIDASRMRYQGFGGSRKPYPLERDEEEKSMNRRVEIEILGK